jgi:putative spermidine/putrescine transport system ATP-binding protein
MRDGLIEQIDVPEVLYRKPASLFAARFLGEANLWPVSEGRLAGFDTRVAVREGTAVVRPEDLTLGSRSQPGAPVVRARVRTASFQGTRYRIEAEHPELDTILASMPPDIDPLELAPGLEIEIACAAPASMHVIGATATASDPSPVRA